MELMDGFEEETKEKGPVIQMGWKQRAAKDGSAVGSEGWATAVYIFVCKHGDLQDSLNLWQDQPMAPGSSS